MNQNLNKAGQKRVMFTPETHDGQKPYTPLAQSKRHKERDAHTTIKELWIRLSQSGEYEHLRRTLSDFHLTGQMMETFFFKEGPFLLRFSLLHTETPDALRFICENVPEDILKKILMKEDYYALNSFLLGDSGLEEDGLIDEKRLMYRLEKISLLMKVDPEGLKSYMEGAYFKTHFSEGVKKSFQQIVQEDQFARSALKC